MGYVYAEIELGNPSRPDLKRVRVRAIADTGAMMLSIPEHIALQLQLKSDRVREVTAADAKKHVVPYVGPIEVVFENRNCYVGAIVLGDEVLLGAVPMEDMDLVISPSQRTVVVNPESPNIPHVLAK